jgi:hypothetical protein
MWTGKRSRGSPKASESPAPKAVQSVNLAPNNALKDNKKACYPWTFAFRVPHSVQALLKNMLLDGPDNVNAQRRILKIKSLLSPIIKYPEEEIILAQMNRTGAPYRGVPTLKVRQLQRAEASPVVCSVLLSNPG